MQEHTPQKEKMPPEVRRAIFNWCWQAALGLAGYGVIIFLSAGRLTWVWGWVMLGITGAMLASHPIILVPINPELLAERERGMGAEGTESWDRWLAPAAAGLTIVVWIVAGLDFRFAWSAPFALAVHIVGAVIVAMGLSLFMWAMAANAFFAEGVRIQEERGHTVATGGPYQIVRHPGYSGAIFSQLATPFLLGSWWALIPAVLSAAFYMLRTALEDRTLIKDLPGYADYTQETRFRLLPGIW